MKLKIKFIVAIIFSSIFSIIFFTTNDVQALTQEEAGQYIAEFSINYFNDYGTQTTYNWNYSERAAATRGEKTSGIAGSPSGNYSYENYYAVDCVGWVSMAIYQSLKLHCSAISAIVDSGTQGYVVPTKYGNNYKTDVMEDVTGQDLKPGDILANSHHVMVYVGNIDGHDRIVHSVSRFHLNYNTFEEYRSMNYSAGSDTRGVYQKVYRIKVDAAEKINKSDATTIFKGSGGVTNKWSDSSSSSSESATQDGRIVDVDDKLPLFKHILLTEKYNFNNIKWKRYGHGYNGDDCETKEDFNLGLKYPKDEANTSLDSFIDFSLPYLQTWMIPLSMNAGVSTKGTEAETASNPMFTYSTLKKAMSDIIVNRYDITTCVLTTKYKCYDIIHETKSYTIEFDENGNIKTSSLISTNNETVKSGVTEPEEDVSKKVDVEPEYYIKDALTFDTKISNKFTYVKYSDEDVANKVEDGIGYEGKTEEAKEDEKINEQKLISVNIVGNTLTRTYEKKVGCYRYVYRTWRDKITPETTERKSYTYEDVKEYNKGSILKTSIIGDENGENQTVSYNGKTIMYSAAFASQTKTPEELGLKYEKVEGCETTNYDACRVCCETTTPRFCTTLDAIPGRKVVARWIKDSFVDYGDWVYIPGWGYALVADCGGFQNKSTDKYHLDCFVGQESDVQDDGKGNYSALKRRCINWQSVYERVPGSNTGVTVYVIKAEDIPESLLNGEVTASTNDDSDEEKKLTDDSEFTGIDAQYYNALQKDNEINKVDLMNSRPSEYLEYLRKGTQYSNHIGYTRAYLTFSYSALKRLFDNYFGESNEVPFVYGSSLGYKTYTGESVIKAGQYNVYDVSNGDSTAVGNSPGGSYEWDTGGLQTFDYNSLPGEEITFELSFYCAVNNAMEGGALGTHNNTLVFGNVASNYWSGMSSSGGWHSINNGRNIGTKIYLDGVGLFTVEDRGGSNDFNTNYRIDVFVKRREGESDSAYEARTNSYGHAFIKGKVLPKEYDSHQHANPDETKLNLN